MIKKFPVAFLVLNSDIFLRKGSMQLLGSWSMEFREDFAHLRTLISIKPKIIMEGELLNFPKCNTRFGPPPESGNALSFSINCPIALF